VLARGQRMSDTMVVESSAANVRVQRYHRSRWHLQNRGVKPHG